MKEHRTGFVPVCKQNVRVLNTGTKREVNWTLPNAVAAGMGIKERTMHPMSSGKCARKVQRKGAKTQRGKAPLCVFAPLRSPQFAAMHPMSSGRCCQDVRARHAVRHMVDVDPSDRPPCPAANREHPAGT